ncbi:unnamed protein product [Nippostrongylus brasiliensis]|uniref:DUF736 domain-containing protein n=1 Tax=Nippostrongylus brasiliensis TaxID=27835 RepID=A0A0N4XD66_NIPBR|nr:unnamed protein product [Nippostrongylus brasiliensis]
MKNHGAAVEKSPRGNEGLVDGWPTDVFKSREGQPRRAESGCGLSALLGWPRTDGSSRLAICQSASKTIKPVSDHNGPAYGRLTLWMGSHAASNKYSTTAEEVAGQPAIVEL